MDKLLCGMCLKFNSRKLRNLKVVFSKPRGEKKEKFERKYTETCVYIRLRRDAIYLIKEKSHNNFISNYAKKNYDLDL